MGHRVSPYLGLDEIGSPSPMMIFIIINYLFNHTFWICLLGFLVGAYKLHLMLLFWGLLDNIENLRTSFCLFCSLSF